MKIAERVKAIAPSLTLAMTAKAKKMKSEGIDVVSFGAGEPDFNTPQYIIDAAKVALDKGMTKYTPSSGTVDLRKAVAAKLLKDNGLNYQPADIVVSNGAKHALFNAFAAILNPGDEVIIPAPYWLTYPELVKMTDGVPVYVETSAENNFKLTAEELTKAITPKTAAIIINNPSNPSGVVYSKEELYALAKVLEKTDIYIVSDEIYEKLTYVGEHCSIASYSEKIKNQTIIINGVSKSYSMTGWRIGYTASATEIAKAIDSMQSHMTSNPNSIAQYATLIAMQSEEGGKFLSSMKKTFIERLSLITSKLDKIQGLTYIKPEGAFYVMIGVENFIGKTVYGEVIDSAQKFAELLLDKALVSAIPCEAFGANSHLRLSYAISDKDIIKGVDRIAEFISDIK